MIFLIQNVFRASFFRFFCRFRTAVGMRRFYSRRLVSRRFAQISFPLPYSCRDSQIYFPQMYADFFLGISHYSLLTTHYSLLTTHYSPLTTFFSRRFAQISFPQIYADSYFLISHYSHLISHHSLLTTHYSPPTTHYSLLTTHYSLLTTHLSPLTTHHSKVKIFILSVHVHTADDVGANFGFLRKDFDRVIFEPIIHPRERVIFFVINRL